MKKFVAAVCALAVISATAAAGQAGASRWYKNDRFAVRVPETWEVTAGKDGSTFTIAPPAAERKPGVYYPRADIRVETLDQSRTTVEYAQTVFPELRMRTGFKSYRSGRQVISHTNARWWIISYREQDAHVKGVLFIVVKGRQAFTIMTAVSEEHYRKYNDLLADIGSSLVIN